MYVLHLSRPESLGLRLANTKTRFIGSDCMLLIHKLYAADTLFMGQTYNLYIYIYMANTHFCVLQTQKSTKFCAPGCAPAFFSQQNNMFLF